jgi:hypothetical protein
MIVFWPNGKENGVKMATAAVWQVKPVVQSQFSTHLFNCPRYQTQKVLFAKKSL